MITALAVAVCALVACSSDGDGDDDVPTTGDVPAVDDPVISPRLAPIRLAPLPVARTEVAGTFWRGLIVVVGGLTPTGAASDRVDLYDPTKDSWTQAPSLPLPLHHLGLATGGDRLYVAGGFSNTPGQGWRTQSGVYSLGPGEDRWRQEPAMASPRGALALAAVGDRLVAVGGQPEGVVRRTEVLVMGEGSWRGGPDLREEREHLAVAVSGGRVYAIAGRVGSLESNRRSVESWDPRGTDGWRDEPQLNDTRGGTAAAELGGRPCVAGGEEPGGTIASIECLNGGRWDRVASLAVPRHGLAVVGVGDQLHVIAGGPEPGLTVSDVHEAFVLR